MAHANDFAASDKFVTVSGGLLLLYGIGTTLSAIPLQQTVISSVSVEDAAEGIPFPIPQNGQEVIWNHKMKYRGVAVKRWANQAAPTASGSYIPVRIREEVLGLYWKEGNTIADINNVLTYFYQEVLAPARLAGSVLLVHETLNQEAQPRQAWEGSKGT